MGSDAAWFVGILTFLWFLFYWVFGGVFFALLTLLRLMPIRKVRFSCLFTLAAAGCAFGAAVTGARWAEASLAPCLSEARLAATDGFLASFGCGFFSILAGAAVWLLVLIVVGFLFLAVSRLKKRSWLDVLAERQDPEATDGTHGPSV